MNKQELVKQIVELKGQGMGSRKIAKELGIGKSTVNDIYNKLKGSIPESSVKKPKILYLDLESAPSVVVAFNRFKVNVSQEAVLREGGWLISYAYKWQGDTEVQGNVLAPDEALNADDSGLCLELWELVEQADAVVYHNGLNFDLPLLKARMMVNGLPPIRKVKSIDTLQIMKEFKLNSNKLNSLGVQLGLGKKLDHEGLNLWVRCMEGDSEALQHMLAYNKVDIELLEELYNSVKMYSTRHPNLAVNLGDKLRCNICCSDKVKPTGNTVSTNLSVFTEYVCEECQARFKDRQSTTTKEERKNFLSN